MQALLTKIAEPAIVIIELIGLLFLLVAFLIALYQLIVLDCLNFQIFNERPELRSGMITALEILMVAEIIRTIKSVTVSHVIVVGLLVLVRLFMANTLGKEIEKHRVKTEVEKCLKESQEKSILLQTEIDRLNRELMAYRKVCPLKEKTKDND